MDKLSQIREVINEFIEHRGSLGGYVIKLNTKDYEALYQEICNWSSKPNPISVMGLPFLIDDRCPPDIVWIAKIGTNTDLDLTPERTRTSESDT